MRSSLDPFCRAALLQSQAMALLATARRTRKAIQAARLAHPLRRVHGLASGGSGEPARRSVYHCRSCGEQEREKLQPAGRVMAAGALIHEYYRCETCGQQVVISRPPRWWLAPSGPVPGEAAGGS